MTFTTTVSATDKASICTRDIARGSAGLLQAHDGITRSDIVMLQQARQLLDEAIKLARQRLVREESRR